MVSNFLCINYLVIISIGGRWGVLPIMVYTEAPPKRGTFSGWRYALLKKTIILYIKEAVLGRVYFF